MSHYVKAGLRGHSGRAGQGQLGVDDADGGMDEDRLLLAGGLVGDDGNHGPFGTGAGGGGGQEDGYLLRLHGGRGWGTILLDLGFLQVQQQCHCLGQVHAGTAADTENGIAALLDGVFSGFVDQAGGSVGLDFVPIQEINAMSLQACLSLDGAACFGHIGSANEEQLLAAELRQLLAHATDGAIAEDHGVQLRVLENASHENTSYYLICAFGYIERPQPFISLSR